MRTSYARNDGYGANLAGDNHHQSLTTNHDNATSALKVYYMTKNISAYILSLVALLALFVYGCCSHSDSGISVRPQGDTVITSREVIIDELGRLPTVTFPSGAKIEGLEENTMTPGIAVTLTEQKTTSRNLAYFSDYKPVYIYI